MDCSSCFLITAWAAERVPSKNHPFLSKCAVSIKLDTIQDVILSEYRRPAPTAPPPRPPMKA